LVRGLARERERALADSQARRVELDRSIEEEHETTEMLAAAENKNEALRTTLDQTVAQLNNVRTEAIQFEAEAQAARNGVLPQDRVTSVLGKKAAAQATELAQAVQQIEIRQTRKEQLINEVDAIKVAILKAQEELNTQRSTSSSLEDFIRKIALGSGGYVLDQPTRKEASALLAMVANLREAEAAREAAAASGKAPGSPGRGRPSPSWRARNTAWTEPFVGRRCVACDEDNSNRSEFMPRERERVGEAAAA